MARHFEREGGRRSLFASLDDVGVVMRPGRGLNPVTDLELAEQMTDMGFDRVRAVMQKPRNFGVACPGSQAAQDGLLLVRQIDWLPGGALSEAARTFQMVGE